MDVEPTLSRLIMLVLSFKAVLLRNINNNLLYSGSSFPTLLEENIYLVHLRFLLQCIKLQKLLLLVVIKQFMVTNCSKERPGSIVIKTLKYGILIPIVTPKESYFNADFKYISFIKFSYEPGKICPILENRGRHPLKVI